jgi:hypothetical protein
MLVKPKHYVMWNGVDLELYIQSFSPQCAHTVLQFLNLFQWDKNARDALDYLLNEKYKTGHTVKSEYGPKPYKEVIIEEPDDLPFIVGGCPRCGDMVFGGPVPPCEYRETGRIFVKVCKSCTYYSEIFETQETIIEVEGD